MAYCTIKTMPQTRGRAMRMLILEQQPIEKVALKFGVHRTTIWRRLSCITLFLILNILPLSY